MAWFPDSNWLRALDVKGSTALAVSGAAGAILILAENSLLYLGKIPNSVRAIVVIICILSSLIFLAKIWDYFFAIHVVKKDEEKAKTKLVEDQEREERDRETFKRNVLVYLDTLNDHEKEILSYLVQSNQQSFTADMAGSRIATLKQKNLVSMGSGMHSQLDWPFTVPKFVWEELQRRKDEFCTADLYEKHPWRDNSF